MPNEIFKKNLITQIESCIAKAKSAFLVEHNLMAGEIREILINDLLKNLLPEGFRIGTGKITDSSGNLSGQTDIIIYNRDKYPPLLFDDKKGIFPIESVYYCIEVKTTLTSKGLTDAIKKADKINNLNGPAPHCVLFAFNSNISIKEKELERFLSYPQREIPSLNILCVVDRLYCYFGKGKWNNYGNTNDRKEVTGLITGILNTLTNKKRSFLAPGEYFYP